MNPGFLRHLQRLTYLLCPGTFLLSIQIFMYRLHYRGGQALNANVEIATSRFLHDFETLQDLWSRKERGEKLGSELRSPLELTQASEVFSFLEQRKTLGFVPSGFLFRLCERAGERGEVAEIASPED